MKYSPTEPVVMTIIETNEGTIIERRMDRLLKDFEESLDSMVSHRRTLEGMPTAQRQTLIDWAFSFFIAGHINFLDEDAHLNSMKSDLETRRDLN